MGPSGRAFDTSDNTFRVGLAKFSVDAKESKAGGHIDLIYGQTADIINTGAGTPGTANPGSGLEYSLLATKTKMPNNKKRGSDLTMDKHQKHHAEPD